MNEESRDFVFDLLKTLGVSDKTLWASFGGFRFVLLQNELFQRGRSVSPLPAVFLSETFLRTRSHISIFYLLLTSTPARGWGGIWNDD